MRKRRKKKSGIWSLRIKTQREILVRGLFLGRSTKQLARAIHASTETVRDLIATPEFQSLYAQYEREQMKTAFRSAPYCAQKGGVCSESS